MSMDEHVTVEEMRLRGAADALYLEMENSEEGRRLKAEIAATGADMETVLKLERSALKTGEVLGLLYAKVLRKAAAELAEAE